METNINLLSNTLPSSLNKRKMSFEIFYKEKFLTDCIVINQETKREF